MKKGVLIGVVVVVVVVVAGAAYLVKMKADAAKWAEAQEFVKEESSITREGTKSTAHFVSIIDAPMDKVEKAMWGVENSSRDIQGVKLSELVEQSADRKVVKMQIQALGLLQHFTMEFTRHPAEHRVSFKSLVSQTQDVQGSYSFEPSPDGKRTRLVYHQTSVDKVALPLPQDVIDGATRETFVMTVRGVTKAIREGR
jgi:hypothetical protein